MALADVDAMPADEFADWQAYFQVEPWGAHGMEILFAQLCQVLIAVQGGKAPDMVELMPFTQSIKRHAAPRKKSQEEMMQTFRQLSGSK